MLRCPAPDPCLPALLCLPCLPCLQVHEATAELTANMNQEHRVCMTFVRDAFGFVLTPLQASRGTCAAGVGWAGGGGRDAWRVRCEGRLELCLSPPAGKHAQRTGIVRSVVGG